MRQIFFAIAMLGLLLCGCSEDYEPATGGITGSVSDKTTGEPVATANVTLSPGGQSTVTGSDGSFSFQNLENGTYTISIAKEGYNNATSQVSVNSGEQASTHLLIERIPATIIPDRDILDFGLESGVTTLSFAIVNKDYANLDYTIEYDCPWIKSVKPASGTLASGKTETIVVTINRSLLSGDKDKTILVIRTSNGRAEVVVRVGEFYDGGANDEGEWMELPAAGIAVQKQDLGKGTVETALLMCKNSILGGYSDWRLPTKDELMVLYFNKDLIGGFSSDNYWSSSYDHYVNHDAYYYISFNNGSVDVTYIHEGYDMPTNNTPMRIRAVRTLGE